MKNICSILLAGLLGIATLQAQETKRVAVSEIPGLGLTYRLPATAMRIQVRATCTQTEAGQFAPYAEKYLGLTDAPQQNQTEWKVVSVQMVPEAVPDTSRIYHVTFSEKGALPTFYLTADGYLTAINREPDHLTPVKPEQPAPAADQPITLRYTDVLSEDILKAASKAKQAELTAREIFDLRESVRDLLRGDVDNMPSDGKQLQIMVDNLRAQEQALLSLFQGVVTVKEVTRDYLYIPSAEAKDEVLFRFSRHYGFVDPDDLSGEPYQMNVHILEDQRMNILEVDPKLLAKFKTQKGIAYCVPGRAHVALRTMAGVLSEDDYQLGQLGHVEQLPVDQFTDKKKECTAAFDPMTGSVRLFTTEIPQK